MSDLNDFVKILVFTIGDLDTASTKFRIAQYQGYLEQIGIEVDYLRRTEVSSRVLKIIDRYDIVINQKCLFNNILANRIIAKAKRVIFDFDDAIWTRPGKPFSFLTQMKVNSRLKVWLQKSDVVLCANQYLGDYAKQYSDKVQVLPMALDMTVWHPAPQKREDGVIRIGWAGSPVNLINVEYLDFVFSELHQRYSNLEVRIYCGKKPELKSAYLYTPFSSGSEPEFVRSLDIGLLPLEDHPFSRGKSPIKAIQYLASGVTAVGNIYGATAEILRPEHSVSVENDWLEKLSALIDDPQKREATSAAGLSFARKVHDAEKCQTRLFEIISAYS